MQSDVVRPNVVASGVALATKRLVACTPLEKNVVFAVNQKVLDVSVHLVAVHLVAVHLVAVVKYI
jgi:hypothetical protein